MALMILNQELLEEAERQAFYARVEFMKYKCKKCFGTPLQKKRKCDILYGYPRFGCKEMDKFVEKANKEINMKMLAEVFST